MPKIHEMLDSKFLKKEDVGAGVLLTVENVIQKNVAQQGADPEMKWCLTFVDCDKPFVLNSTNIQLCKNIFGSDDTDHWIGKPIVLYTDPNVSYAGKIVGGIRVRKPKATAANASANSEVERLKAQLAAALNANQGSAASMSTAPAAVAAPVAAGDLADDDIPF